MSSLKDLEAAFEAELNLASCRLEALGLIKEAVEQVAGLGFRVDFNPSCSPRGELVDLTFWLDAFDSKIEAEFVTDEAAPDFTVVEEFIGSSECGAETAPDLSPMRVRFVGTSQPEQDAAKDAQPDSDPVPAPVAEPAPSEPQAGTDAVKRDYHDRYAHLKPGKAPLTDEDVATIRRMSADKAESGAIAEALGRDPRGFYHIINRVMASATPDPVPAKGVPQAVVPSAPAAPVAEVAASAPAVAAPLQETKIGNAVDAPPLGALSDADKRLDARLEAIGNKGKFTDPADDLYLVENLASGKKLAHVAAELDIDPAVCKHRFDLLVPTKTAQEQEQVARALRRRAIAARARAA